MKRKVLGSILTIAVVLLATVMIFSCGGETDRKAVEDKLTDAGFTIVVSSEGSGLISGTVIVTKEGFDENVVISIYKKESDVPQATTEVTKPCKNLYIVGTNEELVEMVYNALK